MTAKTSEEKVQAASDWWSTEIIDIHPGEIAIRGYPIQELIGNVDFAEMIWLMLRGELPSQAEVALLDATLVASVDHGPQAPAISIARRVSSCPRSAHRMDFEAISASDSDAPSVSARIRTANTPPASAPVGCPCVSAANSVPRRKASCGDSC